VRSCAPDFEGHGRSEAERIESIDDFVDELASIYKESRRAHPSLPVILIGHSLGGLFATRFVQRDHPELTALVQSAPMVSSASTCAFPPITAD
jgi:alpha-beta hydrolase superfamily lysophospholipase